MDCPPPPPRVYPLKVGYKHVKCGYQYCPMHGSLSRCWLCGWTGTRFVPKRESRLKTVLIFWLRACRERLSRLVPYLFLPAYIRPWSIEALRYHWTWDVKVWLEVALDYLGFYCCACGDWKYPGKAHHD